MVQSSSAPESSLTLKDFKQTSSFCFLKWKFFVRKQQVWILDRNTYIWTWVLMVLLDFFCFGKIICKILARDLEDQFSTKHLQYIGGEIYTFWRKIYFSIFCVPSVMFIVKVTYVPLEVPLYIWISSFFQDTERAVTRKEGINLAKEYGCIFIECSAKTRVNIQQCFEELVLKV